MNLRGTGYTRVQDDTGKTYPARISFGDSAEGGQIHSVLIADAPYNVTLVAENISSQATEVRAVDIGKMNVADQLGKHIGYVKLVLSNPPLPMMAKAVGQAALPDAPEEPPLQAPGPVGKQKIGRASRRERV